MATKILRVFQEFTSEGYVPMPIAGNIDYGVTIAGTFPSTTPATFQTDNPDLEVTVTEVTDFYVWIRSHGTDWNYQYTRNVRVYPDSADINNVVMGIIIANLAYTVPYTGATQNVNLGEFGITAGYVGLDLTPTNTPIVEGTMSWNDGDGTMDLIMKGGNVIQQVGQELLARAFNAEATTLVDGEMVYIYGSQGNRISVKRASNSNESSSSVTIGMVTETIASGTEGFVTIQGTVHHLNTTGLTAGSALWLGSTPGTYTQTKPQAPLHSVLVGYVERVHATVGSIYVKVQNGYELDELHNVKITSVANNQALIYNSAESVWKNRTIFHTSGYIPRYDFTDLMLDSPIFSNATKVAIGTESFIGTNLLTVQGGIWGEEITLNDNLLIHSNTLSGNAYISRWSGTTWDVMQSFYADHIVFSKDIESTVFKKTGGMNYQFLMADGSTATVNSLSLLNGVLANGFIPRTFDATNGVLSNSQIWDAGFNLGIGTTTPAYKWTVVGSMGVWSSSTNYGFQDTANTSYRLVSANGFQFTANNIGTVATTTVDATGKWGFGIGTPVYKVDVNGDVNITTGSSYRINGSAITTSDIPEGSRLYFTSNRVLNQVLTGLNPALSGTMTATDSLIEGLSKVQYQLNNKENTITAGTTAQYWRGDKTWQTLNTDAVPESGTPTNKYYTNSRTIASTLTGYVSGAGTISASDSVLSAIQKLNGNISAIVSGVSSVSGTLNRITASPTSGAVVVDIASTYVGQTSITTLGTIGTGTWNGTAIIDTYIASSANWNTAYADRMKWDGGATGLVASTGRTSLGATTVGSNLFTLTNPTAITFLRVNADNTVSTLNATDFRTAIGAGTGNGTVTSVSVVTANGVSGSVATATTTPAITLTLGAITPSSVNGLTLTSLVSGFSIAGGTTSKTLTVSNTLTLAGTDTSTLNIGGGGTLGSAAFTASSAYQPSNTNLTSLAGLTYASSAFVKMTGANTFTLDTTSYQPLLTNPVTGTGTTNYHAKFTGTTALGNSLIYDDGSNIGIGTSTITAIGTYRTAYFDGTGGSILALNTNGTNTAQIQGNVSGLTLVAIGALGQYFYTNGSERMRITSTGNVSIGNTNNTYKLDVTGVTRSSSAILKNDSATPTYLQFDATARTSGRNYEIGSGYSGVGNEKFYIYDNTANAARLVISDTGNVSIGNTNNTYKLDVSGTGMFRANLFLNQDSGGYTQQSFQYGGVTKGFLYWENGTQSFNFGSASELRLYSNNTLNATLNTSGNLGLGVTPSTWGTLKALEFPYGTFFAAHASFPLSYMGSNAYYDGTNWIYKTAYNAELYLQDSTEGKHKWFTAPSGTAGTAITFTQAMTLDASGNLLISQTSPIYSATNRANLTIGQSSGAIIVLGTSTASNGYLFYNATDLELANNNPSGIMKFSLGGTERARIDASGNLMVGTTSAGGYKLNVNGSGYFGTGLTIPSGQGFVLGSATDGFGQYYDGTNYKIYNTAGGATFFSIVKSTSAATFSGSVTATGNASTNSAIIYNNSTGASGTAQYYSEYKAGSTLIGRISRGNGLSGLVANGLNIDNYGGFQVRANQLGGSGEYILFNGANVGIGTTNPSNKLTIYENNAGTTVAGNNSHINIVGGTNNQDISIGFSDGVAYSSKIGQGGAGSIYFAPSGTERMRITSGGYVGIGTSTFNYGASTRGTLAVNGSTDSIIEFQGASTTNGYLFSTSTSFEMSAVGAKYLTYSTNGTERMRISSTGNVSIGNTNNTYKLDVSGDINISAGSSFRINGTAISAGIGGSGTANKIPKFATSSTLGDSLITDNGAISIGALATVQFAFNVKGASGNYISFWSPTISGVGNNGFISHNGGGFGSQTPMGYNASLHVFNGEVTGGGTMQVAGDVNISGAFKINGTAIGTGGGGVSGSGTTGYYPLWTSSTSLGNSWIFQTSAGMTIGNGSGYSGSSVYLFIADTSGSVRLSIQNYILQLHNASMKQTTAMYGEYASNIERTGYLLFGNAGSNYTTTVYTSDNPTYGDTAYAYLKFGSEYTQLYSAVSGLYNTSLYSKTTYNTDSKLILGAYRFGTGYYNTLFIKWNTINLPNIPTASTGLSAGDVYRDGSGFLKIV